MVDSLGSGGSWNGEGSLASNAPDTASTLVAGLVASGGVVGNLVGADGDGSLVVGPFGWLGGIGHSGGHGNGGWGNNGLDEAGAVGRAQVAVAQSSSTSDSGQTGVITSLEWVGEGAASKGQGWHSDRSKE